MITDSVSLTNEQERAVFAIFEYLADPHDMTPFVLAGLAGTGKTTVLGEIALQVPHAILCTLTGKAASVLRRKTGLPACTIHSAFYKLIEVERDKAGKRVLHFDAVHGRGDLAGKIVLIDECSMISERMAVDIISTGAKIVASGDPGQLPPVRGVRYFNYASFTLTEIHRQALLSPIIRQAHRVRKGAHYLTDLDESGLGVLDLGRRSATEDEALSCEVVLCNRNDTRVAINHYVRRIRGFVETYPMAGEPVMCLKNAAQFGIFNGAVYTLAAPFVPGDTHIHLDVDGDPVVVPFVTFEGMHRYVPSEMELVSEFAFGYAMTVHKAQGSEWKRVLLVDEQYRHDVRKEWIYTALTRASEHVLVTQFTPGYVVPAPLPF